MAVTITPATPLTPVTTVTTQSLWRRGAAAGVIAAAATTAVAAAANAAGVSFESAPGEAIPIAGFAQLTFVFTMVGVVIARCIERRGACPRSTFTKTAVVLTVLSLVPDVTGSFDVASMLTLMLTHVVAAVIVIPRIASCLPAPSAARASRHQ